MIYVFGSIKGGTGKSTDAVNFVCWLANRKKKVCLLDSDPISTSFKWASYRGELSKVQSIPAYKSYGDLKKPIKDLLKKYEYIVIDTPGHDSTEMRSAATLANHLIIPFKCSQPDLDTLEMLQKTLQHALNLNPELKINALLSIAPTNPKIKLQKEAREFLSEFPLIKPLKTVIKDRLPYVKSMSSGMGVIEFDKSHAKKEINSLGKELTR